MSRLPAIRSLCLLAALVAAGPAAAQRTSLADRVAALEQKSAAQTQGAGQANVELLNRLTALQGDVQALRNQVEQLQNENEQLKQQAKDRYVDLDTRMARLEGGGSGAPPASGAAPVVRPAPAGSVPMAAAPANSAPAPASSGPAPADESAAYDQAYKALITDNDAASSARLFNAFLHNYPNGALASNAWYWLGESYYVTQNYDYALQSFQAVLSNYPESRKRPDALLKVGYCQIALKRYDEGQATLRQVLQQYPGHPVSDMAQSRLRSLSIESH